MKRIAITSGYFNPIHPGHIECFKKAKEQADYLCVIVNNDQQAELKRGIPTFQKQEDRISIVESIKWVDSVVLSEDQDLTVCKTLKDLIIFFGNAYHEEVEIFFAKGGDRFSDNCPEKVICDTYGVKIIDGLGKKTHNSSDYIKKVV